MVRAWGKPYPVSPLIRGLRYVFLIAGFFYGLSKKGIYGVQERAYREEQARLKVIRDRELALLKAKIAREEAIAVKKLESGTLFDEL
ncbi:unnamed protein product [Arctia plantaginis]|uniref:ATP synthase F(0) complex subunit e, mitochondrial n=1 Tax=Arctia plantaginis TaxID=874455 RepID=A0A8S0ZYH3_ARCPL|nr:unnamed protein product [Arctia plantaginis]CAB3239156.1 unnamed protein product [Arctia plantaginis]